MLKKILYLSLLLVAFGLVACGGDGPEVSDGEEHTDIEAENGDQTSAVYLSKEMLRVANLDIVEVVYRQMHRFISAPAKVIPNQNREAHVGPLIEGRAAQILVNPGNWVKAGQVLMFLESPQVGEAKSAYFKARAELAFAEADHERHKKLFEEKIGSRKGLAEAEAMHQKALAELDATEKHLHAIGFSADEIQSFENNHESTALLPIKAPLSGTIVERNVTLGERLEPSSSVFHIMDLSTVWVDADVYEKDIGSVKLGQTMRVTIPAYPDEVFEGKVNFISHVLDERTRTFKVRAEVINPKTKLKPAMFAEASIILQGESEVLAVPKEAIQLIEQRPNVFVKQDANTFIRRTVRIGQALDRYVEILAGLQPGEIVVSRGSFILKAESLKESFGEGGH